MKYALATLLILLGGHAYAAHESFVIGTEYADTVMTGCISRDLADIVVKSAKEDGSGKEAFTTGLQLGVCGSTTGTHRFVEAIEPFTEPAHPSHPDLWYVHYQYELGNGQWKDLWGFTTWVPSVETENPTAPPPSQ